MEHQFYFDLQLVYNNCVCSESDMTYIESAISHVLYNLYQESSGSLVLGNVAIPTPPANVGKLLYQLCVILSIQGEFWEMQPCLFHLCAVQPVRKNCISMNTDKFCLKKDILCSISTICTFMSLPVYQHIKLIKKGSFFQIFCLHPLK